LLIRIVAEFEDSNYIIDDETLHIAVAETSIYTGSHIFKKDNEVIFENGRYSNKAVMLTRDLPFLNRNEDFFSAKLKIFLIFLKMAFDFIVNSCTISFPLLPFIAIRKMKECQLENVLFVYTYVSGPDDDNGNITFRGIPGQTYRIAIDFLPQESGVRIALYQNILERFFNKAINAIKNEYSSWLKHTMAFADHSDIQEDLFNFVSITHGHDENGVYNGGRDSDLFGFCYLGGSTFVKNGVQLFTWADRAEDMMNIFQIDFPYINRPDDDWILEYPYNSV
jgi:hypothetical protein